MTLDDILVALRTDGVLGDRVGDRIEIAYTDEESIIVEAAPAELEGRLHGPHFQVYDHTADDDGPTLGRYYVIADERTAAHVAALMYRRALEDSFDAEATAEGHEKAVDEVAETIAQLTARPGLTDRDRGRIDGLAEALNILTGMDPDEITELVNDFKE